MSVRWEVATLKISADPAGTSLYANGRMQVAANVLIKAFNPTDKSSYTLTAAELARIELCDYYNTNEKLTGPWTYTATENEFAHTMPLGSVPNDFDDVDVAKASAQAAMADQHKKYWVSTTRAEVKSVGARIQQPNGTVITTRNAPNDSNIAFRASVDIRYSLANTEWWREDTTHGSGWDQDNYFLRSKGHRFIRADRQHFSGSNYPVVGMRNSIAYHQGGPNLHFFWPMGGRATQRVGLTHYADGRVHPRPVSIDISHNNSSSIPIPIPLITSTTLISPYIYTSISQCSLSPPRSSPIIP